jgi:TolB-like protein/tetratricopeptide (TPR) repeat protein
MSDSAPAAVFLSYASQDAEAARRICEALRSAGVEVWFDQSELVGGDAWDAKIRGQIGTCALFVPLISAHTQARQEGYFRLEWKLAEDRSHLMAKGKPFIVPVSVDGTSERGALVPDAFVAVQWTRLPGGETSPAFVARVQTLLAPPSALGMGRPRPVERDEGVASPVRPPARSWAWTTVVTVLVAIGIWQWLRRPAAESPATLRPEAAAASIKAPSPTTPALGEKSIAVLPFANLSSEKENEFFADSLQDDVITSLTKIRDLSVISHWSTLAYRDPGARNLKKIAAELGVATVLNGSVRRVGTKVHMNAQLIDARTDALLWAETFDGDASDSFALQASLAQKIAVALKATLTPGERTLIERRPTQNQAAYELYSRALLLEEALSTNARQSAYEPIIALYEQAVAKDPGFALAFVHLSMVHGLMYWFPTADPRAERRAHAAAALAVARRLAPAAPETHFAQGTFAYRCNNDWRGALAEYAVAEPGLPNDAQLQVEIGAAQRRLLQLPEALRRFERAVALNPRDLNAVIALAQTPLTMRRYAQAKALAAKYLADFPGNGPLRTVLRLAQFELDGDYPAFVRAQTTEPRSNDPDGLYRAYQMAIMTGDLPAAERILADPRVTATTAFGFPGPSLQQTIYAVRFSPVARHRALVAFLLDQRNTAARFAEQAIEYYRHGVWNAREQPTVLLATAEAEALAGRPDEAIRDGRAAVAQFQALDEFAAIGAELNFATIQLLLDRRDDALESLRRVMSQPGPRPQDVRNNPIWSRLKDDPRFEEILKSAKVF